MGGFRANGGTLTLISSSVFTTDFDHVTYHLDSLSPSTTRVRPARRYTVLPDVPKAPPTQLALGSLRHAIRQPQGDHRANRRATNASTRKINHLHWPPSNFPHNALLADGSCGERILGDLAGMISRGGSCKRYADGIEGCEVGTWWNRRSVRDKSTIGLCDEHVSSLLPLTVYSCVDSPCLHSAGRVSKACYRAFRTLLIQVRRNAGPVTRGGTSIEY